ncbi:MAG: hypothetical protein AAB316_04745, partial [Bacteroidota bacterium]
MNESSPGKARVPYSERKYWQFVLKLEEAILEESRKSGSRFENFLDRKGFNDFIYNHLGICGGAFVFADKAKDRLLYLHRREYQSKIESQFPEIPFIEIPYNYSYQEGEIPNWKDTDWMPYRDMMDAMFIGTRDMQSFMTDDPSAVPEFYHHLYNPTENMEAFKKRLPFEQKLSLNGFKIIFCTVGEVLFYLYAWRLLFREVQLKGLQGVMEAGNDETEYREKHDFWKSVSSSNLPEAEWKFMLENHLPAQSIRQTWDAVTDELDSAPLHQKKPYSFFPDEYVRLGIIHKDWGEKKDWSHLNFNEELLPF